MCGALTTYGMQRLVQTSWEVARRYISNITETTITCVINLLYRSKNYVRPKVILYNLSKNFSKVKFEFRWNCTNFCREFTIKFEASVTQNCTLLCTCMFQTYFKKTGYLETYQIKYFYHFLSAWYRPKVHV